MATSTLDPSRTLADLVAQQPARAAVLDRLGLDFCCHGQRSLASACAAAGLDVAAVAAELDTPAADASAGWVGGDRAALARYVEDTHHRYLHDELPAVEQLAAKVRDVHGGRHPELHAVAGLVGDIAAALRPHLAAEEDEVFPAIAGLPDGAGAGAALRDAVARLVAEHARLGVQLGELRRLTGDHRPPADGCASYRSLYERLAALEADTHVHIHLENNVLFRAALTG